MLRNRTRWTTMTAGDWRLVLAYCLVVAALPSWGIMERDEWPWNVGLNSPREATLRDAVGGKWYLNLGPTGIRARIYPGAPSHLVVKYVFQDRESPARGKVAIDDVIVGAGGQPFRGEHQFGRRLGPDSGWHGPLTELAEAIETAQGADGQLRLTVWPGGDRSRQKTVTILLERVGRFAASYPFDCPRSERLMKELCDFMVAEHRASGKFGRVHVTSHCLLALMAAGDREHEEFAKGLIAKYADKRYDSDASGFASWGWGYDSIVLGEYYLRYKDRSVLPAMASLATAIADGQTWKNGGYSHRPNPFIMQRIAGGGPKGYGAMATPGGLAMLGQTLFKVGGVPYSEDCYQRIHQAFLRTVNPRTGAVGYGFQEWDHAVIRLQAGSRADSPRGIGYECPTGMQQVRDFGIEWPTQDDPRYRDTGWLRTERDSIRVYDYGGSKRLAVRTMRLPEPAGPFTPPESGPDHQASSALGALAHLIGEQDQSWRYLGEHMARGCAKAPGKMWDGHAAASVHAFWAPLAAARTDGPMFRAYLDYVKSWLILSETHDGGLVIQPWGRDRPGANSDPGYGPRLLPTANAAILLGLSKRRLLITGAGGDAVPVATTPGPVPAAPAAIQERTARKLLPEREKTLNEALLKVLVELSEAGRLRPISLRLSATQARVSLVKAEALGALTLQKFGGSQQAVIQFANLQTQDYATLAQLVAAIKTDSTDAKAMVGVYMEHLGRLETAEAYYNKSNEASRQKLEALFR